MTLQSCITVSEDVSQNQLENFYHANRYDNMSVFIEKSKYMIVAEEHLDVTQ